jgi:gamma-glutamyltranspeptidase/glutathione hydrolase
MSASEEGRSARAFRNAPTGGIPFTVTVRGRRLAVAAHNHLAAQAGLAMLYEGGNAVDAAMAAVLVEGLVDPHMFTLGGECPILLHRPGRGVVAVNGNTQAPQKATPQAFAERGLTQAPDGGILSAGVPAALAAIVMALSIGGRLPFSAIAAPALELAQNGFPVHRGLVAQERFGLFALRDVFCNVWPASAAQYCPDGHIPHEGALLANPSFAGLLDYLISAERHAGGNRDQGLAAITRAFYKGDPAESIAAHSRARDGLLEAADLAAYSCRVERPVSISLHGHDIFKCPPWNQGPAMLQALLIHPGASRDVLQDDNHIHHMIEAVKLAYADRDQWYADPLSVPVPIDGLLSARYAQLRRALIDPGSANGHLRPGDPIHVEALLAPEQIFARRPWGSGTVHVSAVDADGTMVSATPSGGWLASNEVVADLGFPLSNRLQTFYLGPSDHPNVIAPGKQPRTTISPTLVMRDGSAWLACGSMGGDQQDQWQLQVLLNRIVFGRTLAEAIDAPRWSSESFPGFFAPHDTFPNRVRLERALADEFGPALASRGHRLMVGPDWTEGFVAVERDLDTGTLSAAVDPRGAKSEIFSPAALAV